MPFSRRNSTSPLRFWFPVSVPLAFILTKSTFLRQTASIGVSHMSAEGAVCGLCACPRNDPTSPTCRDATAFAMLTKLGTSCNPDDVIKCAHFCYDRYGGFRSARDRMSDFPILTACYPLTQRGATAPTT